MSHFNSLCIVSTDVQNNINMQMQTILLFLLLIFFLLLFAFVFSLKMINIIHNCFYIYN